MSTSHQILSIIISFHHSYPYFTNNKQKTKKFNPLLKTKKSLFVDIALRADTGQWQFTSAKICSPPNGRETKRESHEARSGYRITRPRGYSGVTGVRGQRQNKSNQTLGNSPRRWRRARAYIDITHTLELEHTTLSISRSTISLRDPFLLVLEQIFIHDQISQISFFLYNARSFEYFFVSFTHFIIYVEIWHRGFQLNSPR